MNKVQQFIKKLFKIDNEFIYQGHTDEEYVKYAKERWHSGYKTGVDDGSISTLFEVKRQINLIKNTIPDNYPYLETKKVLDEVLVQINNLYNN